MKHLILYVFIILSNTALLSAVEAKSPFDIAIKVNEHIITHFEIDQRIKMLEVFGTIGNLREKAVNALIEERLYLQAGREYGILPSLNDVMAGMEEFAARGNLTLDQFQTMFKQEGIREESLHDFIYAGIVWLRVQEARFAQHTRISNDDIDAALNFTDVGQNVEFLLSEIVLATEGSGNQAAKELALRLSNRLFNEEDFAAAARKYSIASTKVNGGKLNWLPARAIPANIVAQLLALKPSEISGPVVLNGNIAIFQLHEIRKSNSLRHEPTVQSYSLLAFPKTTDTKIAKAKARVLRATVDTCTDMRAQSDVLKDSTFRYDEGTSDEIPSDITPVLANLDPKETATLTLKNGQIAVIMLCNRTKQVIDGEREEIRSRLFVQEVANLGNGYLEELKSKAVIVYQ